MCPRLGDWVGGALWGRVGGALWLIHLQKATTMNCYFGGNHILWLKSRYNCMDYLRKGHTVWLC